MRSSLAIVAFAAGALAVPYNKRDVVTAYDVVYATQVVTVTAGGDAPKQTPAHYGHNHNSVHTKVVTYEAPAPKYEAPATTYEAPAPTSEAPKETYVAPSSTKEKEASKPTGYGAAPTDYKDLVVYHHNIHRANHSVPDVEWDDELYSCAQEIAASCVYAHNTDAQGGGYGQNIAAGVEPANVSAIISDLFYNGEEPYFASQYGQDDPDMTEFEKWGHFTQIVWKDTTHVACATQHCPGGLANTGSGVSPYFTVCNYKGPGNYAGEYAANVLKPIGQATADWSFGLSL